MSVKKSKKDQELDRIKQIIFDAEGRGDTKTAKMWKIVLDRLEKKHNELKR